MSRETYIVALLLEVRVSIVEVPLPFLLLLFNLAFSHSLLSDLFPKIFVEEKSALFRVVAAVFNICKEVATLLAKGVLAVLEAVVYHLVFHEGLSFQGSSVVGRAEGLGSTHELAVAGL